MAGRESGPGQEPRSEQPIRDEIDTLLETYHETLALQKERPDDPELTQKAGTLRARLQELSGRLTPDPSLDPAWRAEADRLAEDAASNDIRRRFSEAGTDQETQAIESHDAQMIEEGERLLEASKQQRPEKASAAEAAERASHQNSERPEPVPLRAEMPDTRDLPYATLVAAFAVDGKQVELPPDTETLEEDFRHQYERVLQLTADAEELLRNPQIAVDGSFVELLNACRSDLAEMRAYRRKMKDAFQHAVQEHHDTQARRAIRDDLRLIGHPADTPLVQRPQDLTDTMTFFTKLNFYQPYLEQLLRKYSH
ncbi:MAG: hypothetical protein HY341_00445 [Candidatus Kerfeldbacteria bacterium]|nr:hypothetical protein [Candidatus Kerfeldbacteria bacterium]